MKISNRVNKTCVIHKEEIIKALKSAKLKITPIRVKLLDALEHAESPVRVKDIFKTLKSDIVTVYRNLEMLMKAGLALQVFLDQKHAYFELKGKQHHHHAVCENCGCVADIHGLDHKKFDKQALKASGFANINRHSLEFFGICKSCANGELTKLTKI